MTAEKRLVRVTAANLKHNHLYVTGMRDFFPPEAIGGPRRKNVNGHPWTAIDKLKLGRGASMQARPAIPPLLVADLVELLCIAFGTRYACSMIKVFHRSRA